MPNLGVAALLAGTLALAGCGGHPEPPLPDGAEIAEHRHSCPVTPDTCMDEDLILGKDGTSEQLLDGQLDALRDAGWKLETGVTSHHTGARHPDDDDVFVSVSTAEGELVARRTGDVGGSLGGALRRAAAGSRPAIFRTRQVYEEPAG